MQSEGNFLDDDDDGGDESSRGVARRVNAPSFHSYNVSHGFESLSISSTSISSSDLESCSAIVSCFVCCMGV